MTSHHQDSVVLNSPSTSPAIPPRAAPVGGKTCPAGHVYKPHLPHHALPPITPPLHPMDKPATPKSPVDRTKHDHEHHENIPDQDQPTPPTTEQEDHYIPEAAEENTVHSLLGQAAKRQYI